MSGAVHADLISWLWGSVTLCLSAVIYMYPLKHKDKYWLRLTGCSAGVILISILLWKLGGSVSILYLGVYYLLTAFFVAFCTAGSWKACAYCALWIFITQQMAYEIWEILYGISFVAGSIPSKFLCSVLVVVILYAVAGLTLAKSLPENGVYPIGPRQLASAIFLLVVFELLFVFQIMEYGNSGLDAGRWIIILVQVYCVSFLEFQNILFRKSAMKQELDTLNHLWHQQKEQYALSKENIELINRKCHDLKHQLAAMRTITSSEERESYIKEMEDSVQIYGSIVKTGNEVLDTVLTEKSLICTANNIRINCIADGRRMDVLDPVDVYTVFGNALDNAIESVKCLSNCEKRLIDVVVFMEKKFLFINIMNPIESKLKFEDGIPLSTKIKNGYHGFGLKSIRHTVEKYEGYMKVVTENQIFSLRILIPIQESDSNRSMKTG
ncbi:MAG: ATP-binding protein [Lachnospiraceae bacterium]|nr:ATP-binding protein [Lachnospiraceae bacterium]